MEFVSELVDVATCVTVLVDSSSFLLGQCSVAAYVIPAHQQQETLDKNPRYRSCTRFIDSLINSQVYKMNLVDVRPPAGQAVDSARQNLANTFVNAFVNAGFGQDKLMTAVPGTDGASSDSVHWIFKNKVRLVCLGLQLLYPAQAAASPQHG